MRTFDVLSGQLYVCDPCYKKGTTLDASGNIVKLASPKAKNGRWISSVELDEKVYQSMVCKLTVAYSAEESEMAGFSDPEDDYRKAMAMILGTQDKITTLAIEMTCESGLVGIFDSKSYQNDKVVANASRLSEKIICEDQPWYSICCDRVLTDDQWGVIPNGCVSHSPEGVIYGTVSVNGVGEVVKVEIDFSKKSASSASSSTSISDEDVEFGKIIMEVLGGK